jgi:translocation and assembly module TamB
LDAHLRGALDMRLLESLSPLLERTSGQVELNAAIRGEPNAPLLVGSAHIQDVGLSVRGQDLHLRDLTGDVRFSDARILLDGLEGVLNEGRLTLSGDAVLDRFSLKRAGLHAHLDGVAFRPLPDLPLTASGELLLSGSPSSSLKLSGDLTVDHLRYEQPIVLESFLQRVLSPRAGGLGQSSREWLALDVGVKLADARVDNNLARARLFGSLRVRGTNLHPGLVGTLEAGAGGLAYFRGNRFDVTQGLMEFRDRSGIDAVFDLHAQSQVREYLVRLHAFGRTSDPKLLLTAEPPLAEADILSLLTLGITSRDKTSTAGTSAGLAAEAFLSATGLDRQLDRFLPKNAVFRDLSLRVSTLYNGATGLVEPTPQLESKLLTEQLKIRVAQPVSGRGTRAQAEYNFTDRVSAQAQWDNENVDYSFGNLGLDLKLRWDVE